MGKKKQQKGVQAVKSLEEKGKKTYVLPVSKTEGSQSVNYDGLQKITIPTLLEKDLLDLIQSSYQQKKINKELSLRLNHKKLMDIYMSLKNAGFVHKQIEQAMEFTILHGGDVLDALDWLCLHVPNEKLPCNFSQALHTEEEKSRPKFDTSKQSEQSQLFVEPERKHSIKAEAKVDSKAEAKVDSKTEMKSALQKHDNVKDWILEYATQGSDSDVDDLEKEDDYDPNSHYLELTAFLLDAREEALEMKKTGNTSRHKELSKHIGQLVLEMESLEQHPDFNPEVKIKDNNSKTVIEASQQFKCQDSQNQQTQCLDATSDATQNKQVQSLGTTVEQSSAEDEDFGFSLFQLMDDDQPKSRVTAATVKEDFRSFEYTRQQWTGKSPKQFLLDWCSKHLQKSSRPKFKSLTTGNKFKCIVMVDRQKEGLLEVCPDTLCGNVKEAEHVAATLALYHLCKGQPVYQLLPPPYRNVWLEWADAEKLAADEEKFKENKPRDQFLSKLMSQIQMAGNGGTAAAANMKGDDVVDTWEDRVIINEQFDPHAATSDTVAIRDRPKSSTKLQSMRTMYAHHQTTALYKEMLRARESLPVYQHKDIILNALQKHSVVLVAGETGTGKSTQVPHFILQECLLTDRENCNIVCTEPRRISAISLATRVSQEMGVDKLGGHDSLCGYQIRFESKVGVNTRLTYCTTGVLLRKLQLDPILKHITHVIVDEVHERSVQSDFLLIILRQLLQQRSDLKVILMSATLDADKFSAYFNHCPLISIKGQTFPVEVLHLEDVIELTGYVLDEDSPYSLRQSDLVMEESTSLGVTGKGGNQLLVDVSWTKDDISKIDNTDLPVEKYSLKTRNTVTRMNLKRINMDLIVELLLYIERVHSNTDGAALVFMPGLADITELHEMLQSDARFMDRSKYRIIALHSVLSSSEQSQAFSVPPQGVRKIVLATNIAETGITIPDVVFVIDSGKVKENRYVETSQMNCLEEVFISKASAKQRQGRAGRVRSGFCFRLLTRQMCDDMKPFTVPELLRVPLEELCLHIMTCKYGKPEKFLAQALDPPQPQVISRAMSLLQTVGACVDSETLTPLGQHLAVLPVDVRIGKMLLYAAIFDCLEPVAVIAASMTDKSPFAAPIGKQDMVNAAKQSLAVAASDHITLYKAYVGWLEARSKGHSTEMSYCRQNFLKRNTLLEIENVRRDLVKLVQSIGFQITTEVQTVRSNDAFGKDSVLPISKVTTKTSLDPKTVAKVKAVLTAGLYPNVAKVTYQALVDAAANPEQKACVAETQQGPAHVHPSSVNRYLQANGWLVFLEKVKSTRVYLRDCTLVTAYPLLLFGGNINVQHTEQLLSVDGRIQYKAYAKTGVIFKELRKLLDDLLAKKLTEPSLDISHDSLVILIEKLLASEKI